MTGLTSSEVVKIVNRYIGVSGGYLGDFSYRTHADFYPEFCDLEINPYAIEGTTRERFISILSNAVPRDQAKIVRGIVERFPIGGAQAPSTRTSELREWMLATADRVEHAAPVASHSPAQTSAVVERAIADAETLLRTSGASSGLDRVHTALHGFLLCACENASISFPEGATLATLLKLIRNQHPAFGTDPVRRQEITQILRTLGSVVDALSPLRNNASAARPNKALLDEPEAMLAINSARTILHYVDARLQRGDRH
jgi:hypothetical protein